MPIHATNEPPNSADEQQRADRLRVRLEVSGSLDQGKSTTVVVHNLSASGVLIESGSQLVIGQSVLIELPEAEAVLATVVWQSPPLFGCRFEQPLSRAALSAAQLRNPLPPAFDPVPQSTTFPTRELLPERLRRVRRELGWSRTELSIRTGLSKPSIWAWETGKTAPRRSNLSLLANAFGVPEDELVHGGVAAGPATPPAEGLFDPSLEPSANMQSLCQTVDAAKAAIAGLAGVDARNVKIVIEY
jgi:transcriptional regulator with XRE-family HTH domain